MKKILSIVFLFGLFLTTGLQALADDAADAKAFFEKLVELNRSDYSDLKLIVLGPGPCRIGKINNNFRYGLTVKCKNSKKIRKMLNEILKYIDKSKIKKQKIRFRTLGCYPLTGGCVSDADTIDKVIQETLSATTSERTSRVIDHENNTNMEKRKKEGYF